METNEYYNGKIYKISDNGNNLVYVGSTVNRIAARFSAHRSKYKKLLEGNPVPYLRVYDIFN